jgi:hypothetical protein
MYAITATLENILILRPYRWTEIPPKIIATSKTAGLDIPEPIHIDNIRIIVIIRKC